MSLVNKLSTRWRAHRDHDRGRRWDLSSTTDFMDLAYRLILERPCDVPGHEFWGGQIDRGELNRHQVVRSLMESEEYKALHRGYQSSADRGRTLILSIHSSRVQAIKQLPKARRIVDLGGSWYMRPEGAMIVMGYPYPFESLSIVELPRERRHDIYAEICGDYPETIRTDLGPVSYVYTSMTDLSPFADGSIDLVYSGQSIEHITRDEAAAVCRQVRRILRPGGYFCLDTPNRAVTAIQAGEQFINPDHKYEYHHRELAGLLEGAGLAVREAKGLNLAARSVATGAFDVEELTDNAGLFDDIESCYLLYYKCQKA